ncbi:MAG: type I secretion system permease/ATPase [Alphaproteobacteria bacterium]|nr:type I secretion system permease/ATPase [Alphaproteobacteria bacterium]
MFPKIPPWFQPYARTLFRAAMQIALTSAVINMLALTMPLYMTQVYDRVLSTGSIPTLLGLSLIAAVAFAANAALDALRGVALSRTGAWFDENMRTPVLRSIIENTSAKRLPPQVLLTDVSNIRNALSGAALVAAFDAPWIPIFCLILWFIHPYFGLLAIGAAVLLLGLTILAERRTRAAMQGVAQGQARVGSLLQEAAVNAETVRAMGLEPQIRARLGAYGQLVDEALENSLRAGTTFSAITKFVRLFVQAAVLALGATLVIEGMTSAGAMLASSIILGRALAPVEQLIGALKILVAGRESFIRLTETISSHATAVTVTKLPSPTGKISVEGLGYTPAGREAPALTNISFTADPGQALAVVGPSGSGKSTLCRLVTGAQPATKGVVRIDGADITGWDRSDLGRHIGYMAQTVELFSGSVAENIARLGIKDDKKIVEAAQIANCHDFILRLPQGYETQIGPGGGYLSGGQRQRIGLARAVFGDPRLLVLDEPNANLDLEGEQALIRAIRVMKSKNITVLLVTQRPELLVAVDRIAVIRDGQLQQIGPRDAVLKPQRPNAQGAPEGTPAPQENKA